MTHKEDIGCGHIYYEDWKIGYEYERFNKDKGKIEYLGIAIVKEVSGRPYDQDIVITFDRDGKTYKHTMAFDYSYRLKIY